MVDGSSEYATMIGAKGRLIAEDDERKNTPNYAQGLLFKIYHINQGTGSRQEYTIEFNEIILEMDSWKPKIKLKHFLNIQNI